MITSKPATPQPYPTRITQYSSLITHHSALSTQHSALSTQYSILSTHHSALFYSSPRAREQSPRPASRCRSGQPWQAGQVCAAARREAGWAVFESGNGCKKCVSPVISRNARRTWQRATGCYNSRLRDKETDRVRDHRGQWNADQSP